MGAQLRFGTAGATGGGFSAQPGRLQPSFVDAWGQPKWDYQRRAPNTWKDKNNWYSRWSFGCRVGFGDVSGADGASPRDLSYPDLFEPFTCDGEGTQSVNFLRGTCKDASGVAVANAIVQGFVTGTDAYLGEVQGNTDGTYALGVQTSKLTPCYLVAYKAGTPDVAGTTVNTLLPTNVDGT